MDGLGVPPARLGFKTDSDKWAGLGQAEKMHKPHQTASPNERTGFPSKPSLLHAIKDYNQLFRNCTVGLANFTEVKMQLNMLVSYLCGIT